MFYFVIPIGNASAFVFRFLPNDNFITTQHNPRQIEPVEQKVIVMVEFRVVDKSRPPFPIAVQIMEIETERVPRLEIQIQIQPN